MAAPREAAGPDLAVIVADKPRGGGRKPPPGGMYDDESMESEESPASERGERLPPGFESAAAEAFPDMSAEQYPALKRLIALCMESSEY